MASYSEQIVRLIETALSEFGCFEGSRGDIAEEVGCVPSQVNYTLNTRFTPEMGFIVESKRGAGGSLRVTRVKFCGGETLLMSAVNAIGEEIDETCAKAMLRNLASEGYNKAALTVLCQVIGERALRLVPPPLRDSVRADIMRQGLVALNG